MIEVRCEGVSKSYGSVLAVDDLALDLVPGGMLALLGPSGCGKTTTLRLIAGFDRPDEGSISIGSRIVVGPGEFIPPESRGVGVVFQDYALFPHYTVAGNVGYPLGRKPDPDKIGEALDRVGLARLAGRYPRELSGGEQQRVALARVLVSRPGVILLDEPLSNLDASLRVQMRAELKGLLEETGVTSVLVTHDQEEALVMADRVAVMNEGRVIQVGEPREVYLRPSGEWVAEFMGEVNRFSGTAVDGQCECDLGRIDVPDDLSGRVTLLIRPEALAFTNGPEGLPGRVVETGYSGPSQLITVETQAGRIVVREAGFHDRKPDSRVMVKLEGPVSVLPATGVARTS